MNLQNLNLEKLHHAYIIFSPISHFESVERQIVDILKSDSQSGSELGSADLIKFSYKSLGVDDAQSIFEFNSRVALGERKIAIVSAENITMQAQNALLKIIEEPNRSTHFFFIVPSKSQILPTVISRTSELVINDDSEHREINKDIQNEVENFLKHPASDRLAIAKEMLAFLEKEKMTRGEICEFISEAVKMSHKNNKKTGRKFSKNQLQSILSIEQFMRDTSSSMKLCLEYLSLVL